MCFPVAPDVCLPDRRGVRIGDVVTRTEVGGRRLSTASRELAIVV